jgi:hypothetical protein
MYGAKQANLAMIFSHLYKLVSKGGFYKKLTSKNSHLKFYALAMDAPVVHDNA